MSLPFTRDQFLQVFRSYNDAIGLAPLILLALAVGAIALSYSTRTWRHRIIAGLLAVLWFWSGVVYHWGFFAAINPAARPFGALFVAQGVVLVVMGVFRGRWQFDARHSPTAGLGLLMIVYAIAIYPLLGWAAGHGYPNGPSFGAPCPITIMSLGMTLWIVGPMPVLALAIPVVWSVIGTSAAFGLGIYEDLGLAVSALIIVITIVRQRSLARRQVTTGFQPTTGRT